MPPAPSALDLLRAVGLMADGPVTWGQQVRSRAPGIFLVELPAALDVAPIDSMAVRGWLGKAPELRVDGERPTQAELAARLSSFWLPRQRVVYVGKTSKSLVSRVASLYSTPLGARRPHPGGHWLKTLQDLGRTRIWWVETDAAEEAEDAVLGQFADGVAVTDRGTLPAGAPVLPWAVLESATGEKRETGIANPFGEDGAGVTASSAPARPTSTTSRTASRSSSSAARKPAVRPRASAAPPKPVTETHLTASGLAAIQVELEELRTSKRPEVILRVKNARELGDLKENSEYHAAREEQSFLEGRIQMLEQAVRSAVVIEAERTGEVMLGSTVKVRLDEDEVEFHIVGSTEADPASGRISNQSPVGRALIGHRVGETAVAQLPGREVRYVIVEVR